MNGINISLLPINIRSYKMSTKSPKLFDLRVVERNIQKGLISRTEYAEYLAALTDVEDQAEKINAEFVENVLTQNKD